MRNKLFRGVFFKALQGAGVGAILGSGGAVVLAIVVFLCGFKVKLLKPAYEAGLLTIVPICALLLGYRLARLQYDENLEAKRLRSHFCKCCGYDLTGCTDEVCPECGTGIPDPQRKRIKNRPNI
jgi:hypothetical protein